ncbi:MAG: RNA polymerase Rpb4 family protein [Candidatus Aenigmatarchaeota archaeon]
MQIEEEQFVSWSRAKKILEKRAKEKELGYEEKNALEFLRKFSKLTDKKTEDLMAELRKVERLKERQIVAIANMLPQDLDELRVLLAHEIVTLGDEDKKKILAAVKKFT